MYSSCRGLCPQGTGDAIAVAAILIGDLTSPDASRRIADLSTPADHAYAASFGRAQRRKQSLLARALLRQLLHKQTGLAGRAWSISRDRGLSAYHPDCHFPLFVSISHSGPAVAAALSVDGRVGIDIERRHPKRDMANILRQLTSRTAPIPGDRDTSFAAWAMYEAWLKARAAPVSHHIPNEILGALDQAGQKCRYRVSIEGVTYRFDVAHLPGFVLSLCEQS